VFAKEWISDVVGSEHEVRRGLNDGVVQCIKEDRRVLQVTAPELIRRDVESASFAVLDLHGALDWSNHNCRIVAIAYMNL